MQPDRAGAPELSSLELRLERLKRCGYLRLDFLKSLYDRRSVAELYLQGEVCLHVHFHTSGGMVCACYFAGQVEETKSISGGVNLKLEPALIVNKSSVFVWVGDVSESARPIASTVWLESLDCCDMRGIETVEPSAIFPKRESLWSVFNGKLGAIHDASRIENGQLIDKIIEGGSEVVTNLPHQNAEPQWNQYLPGSLDRDFAQALQIKIPGNRIMLLLPDGFDLSHKLTKVFVCPKNTSERTIE